MPLDDPGPAARVVHSDLERHGKLALALHPARGVLRHGALAAKAGPDLLRLTAHPRRPQGDPLVDLPAQVDAVADLHRVWLARLPVDPQAHPLHGQDLDARALLDRDDVQRGGPGLVSHLLTRRELRPARRAGERTGCHHLLAVRALLHRGNAVALARLLDLDRVQRTVAHDVLAEVQDQAIRLALVRPQPAAHHLDVEPRALRRTQERDQVYVSRIKARRQHAHVHDAAELLALELLDDPVAGSRRRVAHHHLSRYALISKLLHDAVGVLHSRGEDHPALAVLAASDHLLHRQLDVLAVHGALLKLLAVELASGLLDALGVDVRTAATLRGDPAQRPALDQFGDRQVVGDVVEEGAVALVQVARVRPERRRRQADHAEARVHRLERLEHREILPRARLRDQVRLVHDHQIAVADLLDRLSHRLHAAEQDRRLEILTTQTRRKKAARRPRPVGLERVVVLLHQFLGVGQDQDAGARLEAPRLVAQRRHAEGLARAGRQDDQGVLPRLGLTHVVPNAGDRCLLVVAQGDLRLRNRVSGVVVVDAVLHVSYSTDVVGKSQAPPP